jgi:hypothetical protein
VLREVKTYISKKTYISNKTYIVNEKLLFCEKKCRNLSFLSNAHSIQCDFAMPFVFVESELPLTVIAATANDNEKKQASSLQSARKNEKMDS